MKHLLIHRQVSANLKIIIKLLGCCFLIGWTGLLPTYAQTVGDSDLHEILQNLCSKLIDQYPFPKYSAQYRALLIHNEQSGRYKGLKEGVLADEITADLQQVHKDVHLHIFRDEVQYKILTSASLKTAGEESETVTLRSQNYGFKNADLDFIFSTAYINIPGPFYARQEAFETAAATMNMAAYSDYVIIDIRNNPGGSGEMGRFLASYFFTAGDEQFYLNGFYKDRTRDEQEWTYAYVPGKRNPKAKLYILVGPSTGSAAEGFAFAMQKMHKATIVGDTTAGAGIAGAFMPLKCNLLVFLPFKMVVAPNTQIGWEGTGVHPDSLTTGKDALTETRRFIQQDILKNTKDSTVRAAAQWLMEDEHLTKNEAIQQSRYVGLVGKYNNNVSIDLVKNGFIWKKQEPGKPTRSFELREVKRDVFTIDGLNNYVGPYSTRVYIKRNAQGRITSLEKRILMADGSIYVVPELYRQ